ncbi:MAG: hypothetical protein IJX87_06200 [Clostridia bacterium]|nr:hypothetical protein [Clostridia bacterium]
MDVFYEESAVAQEAKKGAVKYRICHIISNVFLTLGIIAILFGFNFIPLDGWLIWGFVCLWFFSIWFALFKFKSRFNVSYDYVFVTGELRISRVINVNKRKLITRLDCNEMIQVGDIDNSAFERLKADPNTKTIVCTSNDEPAKDKFFMYILANDNGRKLYVLECREKLLLEMMKFLKRTVLESDYVMQEKKQKKI